jgi:hypothetical protein
MRRPASGTSWLSLAFALATLGTLAGAPRRAAAQPDCVAGSVAAYVALAPAGCKIANVRFSDFGANFQQVRAGFTDLDLAAATLTPLDLGGGLTGFRVTFARTLSSFSSGAAVLGCSSGRCNYRDIAVLTGTLTATGLGGDVIRGIGIANFDLAVATTGDWNANGDAVAIWLPAGVPQVHQGIQAGSPPFCTVSPAVVPCVSPLLTPPGPGVPAIGLEMNVNAGVASFFVSPGDPPPPGSASATFTGVDFLVLAGPAAVVPEPATVVLVASGLLGVGAAARRRRVVREGV